MSELTVSNKRIMGGGRYTNIECLRVLAMFFIVTNHCILNIATKKIFLNEDPINFCLVDIIYQIVYNGVNLFVLISGYFLATTQTIKTNWEKVVKLWVNVFFYSVLIYFLIILSGSEPFIIQDFVHCLMPVRYDLYWFVTQYIGLLIVSPFLAKWSRSMSKSEYVRMLFSLFVVTSIWQLSGLKGGFSLVWFVFLFMFSGYVRLWSIDSHIITWWYRYSGIIFVIITAILFIISFPANGNKLNIVEYWGFYNGPLLFITSVSLFFTFLKMKETKVVVLCSKLAPYMFGVYLIHEHPLLKVKLYDYFNNYLVNVNVFSLIYVSVIIIIVCVVIEWLRILLFKYICINQLVMALGNRVFSFIRHFCRKVTVKIISLE